MRSVSSGRTAEQGCRTYMSPMKVPMSNAPKVLSRAGTVMREYNGVDDGAIVR